MVFYNDCIIYGLYSNKKMLINLTLKINLEYL